MGNDHAKNLSRSSLVFFAATLISRLSGAVRDVSMAFCFGSSVSLASFMVAYRLASLTRRLLGEGPLSSGFIPAFEEFKAKSEKDAFCFFRDLFFSLLLFLLAAIAFIELVVFSLYKSQFIGEQNQQIVALCLIMLPGTLFLCLFSLFSAVLQCQKRFFITGLAPVAFNIVWIIAVFALRSMEPQKVSAPLSMTMVIGFFLHFFVLLPPVAREVFSRLSLKEFFHFQLFPKDIRKLIKPFVLGILGVGAMQLNSALDALFSRYASLEAPAHLWYAIRIQQVPVGLFGVAIASALLPALARAFSDKDMIGYKHILSYAMKKAVSVLMPSMAALFVLGASAVNFIYGRGDFSQEATLCTVRCLYGYALGLIPSVFVMLLAPAFFAKKKFSLPSLACLISVVVNVALNYFFIFQCAWSGFSVALATSLASFVNMGILSYFLYKKIGPFLSFKDCRRYLAIALCSTAAAIITLAAGTALASDPTLLIIQGKDIVVFTREFFQQFLQLAALSGVFLLSLIAYAWLFDVREVLSLFGIQKPNAQGLEVLD